jgi:hypothetical protein
LLHELWGRSERCEKKDSSRRRSAACRSKQGRKGGGAGLALAHAKEEEEKGGAWYGAVPRDGRRGGLTGEQDPIAVGAGSAQCVQGRDGASTGGPRALCRVLNWFKPSKSIQTRSNLFDSLQKGPSQDQNFEIKYCFEGFEERNKFLHWNFFRFKIDFEL